MTELDIFNRPIRREPRDAWDRIVREAHDKLERLHKHTFVRLSHLSRADYERARKVLSRHD